MKTSKAYNRLRRTSVWSLTGIAMLTLCMGCNAEHAKTVAKHRAEAERQAKKSLEEALAKLDTEINVAKKLQAMKEGDLDSLPSIIPVSDKKAESEQSKTTDVQGATENEKAEPESTVASSETKVVEQGEADNHDNDVAGEPTPDSEVAKNDTSEVASNQPSPAEASPATEANSSEQKVDSTASESPEVAAKAEEAKQASEKAAEQNIASEQAKALPSDVSEKVINNSLEAVLPKDRPKWLTAKADFNNNVHTWTVNTSTNESEEASKDKLMDETYVQFINYARDQLGVDVKEIKSIDRNWVSSRLVKQDSDTFLSERDGNIVSWARLSVDPATREELMILNQQSQWYPRSMRVASTMLSLVAVFGLVHVGLNATTAMLKKK